MRPACIFAVLFLAFVPAGLFAQGGYGKKEAKTDKELIANATSAAPKSVAKDATVVVPAENGELRTVREGTGNFTCMPDDPNTPGNDPMCVDKNGMAFIQALMSHTDPPPGQVGFGYMLLGGPAASNEDPFAKAPPAGQKWVETGPHIMIFATADKMAGYPTTADDTSKPYVMWPGTPYAHLMVPVR
jgi:hypothetical protein